MSSDIVKAEIKTGKKDGERTEGKGDIQGGARNGAVLNRPDGRERKSLQDKLLYRRTGIERHIP
jgi:hypothetical protein